MRKGIWEMKTRSLFWALGACALMTVADSVRAAETPADPGEAQTAPAPKKKVRKVPEYMSWEQACAVSEAAEQPIVAFVELKGDKRSSKIRMATVAHPIFKEFVKDNCVFYHVGVPQEKVQKGRGQANQKDAEPKPDFSAVKASESTAVTKLKGSQSTLPVIAVVTPGGGRVIGTYAPAPEEASLAQFVAEMKTLFEGAKCELVISKKVQKVLDDEAKKLAARQKALKK